MVDQPPHPPDETLNSGTGPFPDDVWREIFLHARLPVPKPLSRPQRSELRQPTLTALARSCKLLHSLVIPVLYKNVVTDRLGDLLEVKAQKHRLPYLAFIETLYIEYEDENITPTYLSLLRTGGPTWDCVGPTSKQGRKLQMKRCQRESEAIGGAVAELNPITGMRKTPFPRLQTVAVGSIYGHQGDLWSEYDRYEAATRDKDPATAWMPPISYRCQLFWEAVLHGTKVKDVCVRDPTAPLGFPLQQRRATDRKRDYREVFHFSPTTPGSRIHLGQNPIWVSEVPQDQAWTPMYEVVKDLMGDLTLERIDSGDMSHALQIDIYGSTSRLGLPSPHDLGPGIRNYLGGITGAKLAELPVGTQRAVAKTLGSRLSGKVTDTLSDNVRWFPSHDYPGCKCCGSGPPL